MPLGGSQLLRTVNGPFPIVGHARVEASSEIGIVVTLQFVTSGTSEVVASTSLFPEASSTSFSTVVVVRNFGASTGIALLNPSASDAAEIEIRLFKRDGEFFDETSLVLQPGQKIAQFFDQEGLFPSIHPFFGTAEVSSTLPIAATVIRVDGPHWSTFTLFPSRVRD